MGFGEEGKSRSAEGKYPMVVLRDNHECRGKNTHVWNNFFPAPENRTYYSARLGNTFYLFLDSADADNNKIRDAIYPVQREWIKKELESEACRTATFRVAMIHYSTHAMAEKIVNLTSGKLLGDLLKSTDPAKKISSDAFRSSPSLCAYRCREQCIQGQ